eukprot:scpid93576/ scgid24127/ 
MAENPFDNKVFLSDILPWFAKLPPAELRTKVVQKGLIRSLASIDRLKHSLDRDGPSHHNEDIIGLISARELEGYLALCDIIHDMGYKERSVQMRKLVLEDRRQEIDASLGGSPHKQMYLERSILPPGAAEEIHYHAPCCRHTNQLETELQRVADNAATLGFLTPPSPSLSSSEGEPEPGLTEEELERRSGALLLLR